MRRFVRSYCARHIRHSASASARSLLELGGNNEAIVSGSENALRRTPCAGQTCAELADLVTAEPVAYIDARAVAILSTVPAGAAKPPLTAGPG